MKHPTRTDGRLSPRQRALLELLRSEPRPWPLAELAHELETSPEGAAATAASLARRRLAAKTMQRTDGHQRTYYHATERNTP